MATVRIKGNKIMGIFSGYCELVKKAQEVINSETDISVLKDYEAKAAYVLRLVQNKIMEAK